MVNVELTDVLKSVLILIVASVMLTVFVEDYLNYTFTLIIGGLFVLFSLINPFELK